MPGADGLGGGDPPGSPGGFGQSSNEKLEKKKLHHMLKRHVASTIRAHNPPHPPPVLTDVFIDRIKCLQAGEKVVLDSKCGVMRRTAPTGGKQKKSYDGPAKTPDGSEQDQSPPLFLKPLIVSGLLMKDAPTGR